MSIAKLCDTRRACVTASVHLVLPVVDVRWVTLSANKHANITNPLETAAAAHGIWFAHFDSIRVHHP